MMKNIKVCGNGNVQSHDQGEYYDKRVKHMNVRNGEHNRISSLAKKQVKPRTGLSLIVYCFAFIQHPLTILVF